MELTWKWVTEKGNTFLCYFSSCHLTALSSSSSSSVFSDVAGWTRFTPDGLILGDELLLSGWILMLSSLFRGVAGGSHLRSSCAEVKRTHTQAHTLTSGSFWCWMEEQGLLGEWSSCSDQFSAWPSEAQHSALALQPQLCCFPPQASSWGNNGQIHHQSSHPYNHEKIINHNDNESYLTLTTVRSSRDWNL